MVAVIVTTVVRVETAVTFVTTVVLGMVVTVLIIATEVTVVIVVSGGKITNSLYGQLGTVVTLVAALTLVTKVTKVKQKNNIFSRPGEAGAVLQTPSQLILLLIKSVSQPLWKYLQNLTQTVRARELKF